MLGVFVNWSKPFFKKEKLRGYGFEIFKNLDKGIEYKKPLYEVLYTVLSVSYWKKYNGKAKLYTDKVGYNYYKQINLLDLWDEVDYETLENFNKLNIDPSVFWTSGKTFCISHQKPPFVFLDLDFIIRQELPTSFYSTQISIPHWEIPRGSYYPTLKDLNELNNWKPDTDFQLNMLVPNTSCVYIDDILFQKEYWNQHFKLIKSLSTKKTIPEWVWLLSDQGLFGQALRKYNIKVETLTDKILVSDHEGENNENNIVGYNLMWVYNNLNPKKDTKFEHIWIRKALYNQNKLLLESDIKRFSEEIKTNRFLKPANLQEYVL